MNNISCPICDSAAVHDVFYSKELFHRGHAFVVTNLQSSECRDCGASFFSPGQADENKKRISSARSIAILGVSTVWIADFRKKLGLTQGEAGRLFGGGKIAFSRYESGTINPSQALVKLLLVADRVPGVVAELRRIADDGATSNLMSPEQLLERWMRSLKAEGSAVGIRAMWESANESSFKGSELENAA